jgi:tRNA/tmRNA/rRNA uracil-C5-methylase (TrmA/RlmC/RlmD family)
LNTSTTKTIKKKPYTISDYLPSDIISILERFLSTNSDGVNDIPYLSAIKPGSGTHLSTLRYNKGDLSESLRVIHVNFDGRGLCIDSKGYLVLVPVVLEGELVTAKIYQGDEGLGVYLGELVQVLKPSPIRVKPQCKHFDKCSGCVYQHIPYEMGLERKRNYIEEAFDSNAIVRSMLAVQSQESQPRLRENGEAERAQIVTTVVPSPATYGFRTKLSPHHPSLLENRPLEALGLLERGRARSVVAIERCEIVTEAINKKFQQIRRGLVGRSLPYKRNASTIMIRNTLIPPVDVGGASALHLKLRKRSQNVDDRRSSAERLTSFVNSLKELHDMKGKQVGDLATMQSSQFNLEESTYDHMATLAGRLGLDPNSASWPHTWPPPGWTQTAVTDHQAIVTDVVNGQIFRSEANSFFQLNSPILGHLTTYVRNQLSKHAAGIRNLLDLYCGSGLFALQCAGDFDKVLGIELDEASIHWAIQNAQDNGVKNVKFLSGDVNNIFDPARQMLLTDASQVAVVIDPPKKGCGKSLIEQLMRYNPKVIVYVSCQSETLLEDIKMMAKFAEEGVTPLKRKEWSSSRRKVCTPSSIDKNQGAKQVLYLEGGKVMRNMNHRLDNTLASVVENIISTQGKKANQGAGIEHESSVDGNDRLPVKGYKIVSVALFDLFPHTARTETVVTLVRVD